MVQYGLTAVYALFVWWFATGVVLYLDGLPRRTHRWTMAGATVVLAAALAALIWTSGDSSAFGAYGGFTCGVLIWGWHEISFLMGYVTGPRTTACPEGVRGWKRFSFAVQAILYHEIALVLTLGFIAAATWGAVNQVGTWTFFILWLARLSAKLNLFLGVRNLAEEFLPAHLDYMASYFKRQSMNVLLPLSVGGLTIAAVLILRQAHILEAGSFEMIGLMFLGSLTALALLEHWMLVLPLPAAVLWRWGLRSRSGSAIAILDTYSTSSGSSKP